MFESTSFSALSNSEAASIAAERNRVSALSNSEAECEGGAKNDNPFDISL